jgi:spore coat protein A
MFTKDGQLYYPADVLGDTTAKDPSVHPEFFGDTILVNGKAWPVLDVEPRMYRFRVLNGSQARFYDLSLDSGQSFFQIGTDGGLLDRPVSLTKLLIAPAERADIVVDFSKMAGKTLILKNDAPAPFPEGDPDDFNPDTTGQIMEFRVSLPLSNIKDVNLDTNKVLNKVDFDKVLGAAENTRELGLFETTDDFGRLIQKLGLKDPNTGVFTAQDFMGPVTEVIKQGDTEIWKIYNSTGDTHPIHLHQVQFQLVSRQEVGMTVDDSGNFTVNGLIGQSTGPAANEAGWKDTVRMNPGEVTTIRVKFDLPGKYVWHCHILEHEEHDMMRYFLVNSTGTLPTTTANMSLATNSATQTLQPASTLDQMAPPPEVLIGQLPPTDGTPLSTNKRKSLLVQ